MPVLHIAVGVLIDAQGRVLIAQRRAGTPGAGKWEFPGGKLEPAETLAAALQRELEEELGVQVQKTRPMLRFHHDYADRRVLLDIWRVLDWQGEARGREGQNVVWCAPERLFEYDLLSANKPIVDAIRLPATYLITPEPGADQSAFLDAAEGAVAAGARMLRLRAWLLSDDDYEKLAAAMQTRLRAYSVTLILDRNAAMMKRVGGGGLHLSAQALNAISERPVASTEWFAVSCHGREELLLAKNAGADFAVLSPVKPTASHPEKAGLGWEGFARSREDIAMPIYALGGVELDDLETAWQHGGQGIAAIRGLWR